jgi:hypothetical protein
VERRERSATPLLTLMAVVSSIDGERGSGGEVGGDTRPFLARGGEGHSRAGSSVGTVWRARTVRRRLGWRRLEEEEKGLRVGPACR